MEPFWSSFSIFSSCSDIKMAPRSRWVLPKNTTFGLVTPKTTPTNVFRHPNACDVTFERTRSFFAVAQGVRLDKEEFTIHSLQSTCAPATHFNPERKEGPNLSFIQMEKWRCSKVETTAGCHKTDGTSRISSTKQTRQNAACLSTRCCDLTNVDHHEC